MKKFLILLIAAIVVMGLVGIAASGNEPTGKIKIVGKKTVEFDHPAHLKRADGNCQFCHHKDAAGKGSKCEVCHTPEGKDKAIPVKDAFHKLCKKCHVEGGKAKPKVGCKACHD